MEDPSPLLFSLIDKGLVQEMEAMLPSTEEEERDDALGYARQQNQIECFRALLEWTSSSAHDVELADAAHDGQGRFVACLLRHMPQGAGHVQYSLALRSAAQTGKVELVQWILKRAPEQTDFVLAADDAIAYGAKGMLEHILPHVPPGRAQSLLPVALHMNNTDAINLLAARPDVDPQATARMFIDRCSVQVDLLAELMDIPLVQEALATPLDLPRCRARWEQHALGARTPSPQHASARRI